MAATPEKKVKDKVVAILKDEGVYYFFPAKIQYTLVVKHIRPNEVGD